MNPMAADVFSRRHLSYRVPLRFAREWNRSNDVEKLAAAQELLAVLTKRYPHALAVWYEFAFGLVKLGRRMDALHLLENTIGLQFKANLDEDTLSLWGRCYKDA